MKTQYNLSSSHWAKSIYSRLSCVPNYQDQICICNVLVSIRMQQCKTINYRRLVCQTVIKHSRKSPNVAWFELSRTEVSVFIVKFFSADESSGGWWNAITGKKKSTEQDTVLSPEDDPDTIHIFTVASGHMYERLQKIMILSLLNNTK